MLTLFPVTGAFCPSPRDLGLQVSRGTESETKRCIWKIRNIERFSFRRERVSTIKTFLSHADPLSGHGSLSGTRSPRKVNFRSL